MTEYKELAKDVFGVEVSDQTTDDPLIFKLPPNLTVDGQTQDRPRAPETAPLDREAVLADEMNPDFNPLIPGGKAAQEALKT